MPNFYGDNFEEKHVIVDGDQDLLPEDNPKIEEEEKKPEPVDLFNDPLLPEQEESKS